MATYQKATLVLLAVVPALGALRFWAWRFLSVWALYLFGAYRAVAMTKVSKDSEAIYSGGVVRFVLHFRRANLLLLVVVLVAVVVMSPSCEIAHE